MDVLEVVLRLGRVAHLGQRHARCHGLGRLVVEREPLADESGLVAVDDGAVGTPHLHADEVAGGKALPQGGSEGCRLDRIESEELVVQGGFDDRPAVGGGDRLGISNRLIMPRAGEQVGEGRDKDHQGHGASDGEHGYSASHAHGSPRSAPRQPRRQAHGWHCHGPTSNREGFAARTPKRWDGWRPSLRGWGRAPPRAPSAHLAQGLGGTRSTRRSDSVLWSGGEPARSCGVVVSCPTSTAATISRWSYDPYRVWPRTRRTSSTRAPTPDPRRARMRIDRTTMSQPVASSKGNTTRRRHATSAPIPNATHWLR